MFETTYQGMTWKKTKNAGTLDVGGRGAEKAPKTPFYDPFRLIFRQNGYVEKINHHIWNQRPKIS